MSRRPTTDWPWHLMVAALSLAAGSCGSTEPDHKERRGDVCESAADCATSQGCRMGYCTRPSASIEDVRFQFIPPDSSGYSPQTSRGVSVRADNRLNFALQPDVTVDGTITFEGAGSGAVGPTGPLTFKRRSRDDTLFDVQTQVEEGTFEAMVLPGTYDLLFAPEDYPSRIWRNFSFAADTQLDPKLDNLSVPAESNLATIQGTVVFRPEKLPDTAAPRGVASAHVLGVSADGRFTTTVDTTSPGADGDDGTETETKGHFVLRAIPGTGSYDLIIDPGAKTVLPKVRIPDAFEVKDDSESFLTKETTNLGTYPQVPVDSRPASFQFDLTTPEGLSDEDIDWSRTQIVARAHPRDLGEKGESKKEFRRVTTPNGDGRVELTLLPAAYTVWMYPPAESPLASTKFQIAPTQEALETFSNWKLKEELEGRIVDSTGEPVSGSRLDFWPNGLPADRFRDRLKVSATTDENGTFSVPLEPRTHEVTIRPPSGSGLPRHLVTVSEKRLTGSDNEQAIIELPEPLLVRGSVRGTSSNKDARPIRGTAISATVRRDGERRLLGKATTDKQGRFLMIVPASLE